MWELVRIHIFLIVNNGKMNDLIAVERHYCLNYYELDSMSHSVLKLTSLLWFDTAEQQLR